MLYLVLVISIFVLALVVTAGIVYLHSLLRTGKIERQLIKLNQLCLEKCEDFVIKNPYEAGGKYVKTQLHTHTKNSDGTLLPEELTACYKAAGYTFLAITDHDKITEYKELDDAAFMTITGEEMTVPRPFWPLGRHISRLFIKKPVRKGNLTQKVEATVAEDGILIINHPASFSGLGTQRWYPEEIKELADIYLLEIVNHYSDTDYNISYWHGLLKHYGPAHPIWGIAGDDSHYEEDIDQEWIMAGVNDITESDLKQALQTGNFYATRGPVLNFQVADFQISVSTETKGEFIFLDANLQTRKQVTGDKASYQPEGDEGFMRIEFVEVDTGKKAWSQPFWLQSR